MSLPRTRPGRARAHADPRRGVCLAAIEDGVGLVGVQCFTPQNRSGTSHMGAHLGFREIIEVGLAVAERQRSLIRARGSFRSL
jgi:hypothetical protein